MLPTHILYAARTGQPVQPGENQCLLCGSPCADSVAHTSVIRDTFTDHGICRDKDSTVVCLACDHYFNHRWNVGQKREMEYRKQSMHVTAAEFRSWQRAAMRSDIEQLLRDGTGDETLLVIALSKKKHLLPLPCCQTTAAKQKTFYIQFERESVVVSPENYRAIREPFDALLALGCRKGEILSGTYHPLTLRKAPIAEVLHCEEKLAPWRGSGLMSLVSYITLLEDDADGGSE